MFPVDHPSTVRSVAFGLWCSKHEGNLKSSTAAFLKNKNATAMIMQEPLLWTVWELLSTNCSSPCSRTKLSITRSVGYHEQLCWRFFQKDTLALLQSDNSHIKKHTKYQTFWIGGPLYPFLAIKKLLIVIFNSQKNERHWKLENTLGHDPRYPWYPLNATHDWILAWHFTLIRSTISWEIHLGSWPSICLMDE